MNDRDFAELRKELISKGVVDDVPGAELDESGWKKLEDAMTKEKGADNGDKGNP